MLFIQFATFVLLSYMHHKTEMNKVPGMLEGVASVKKNLENDLSARVNVEQKLMEKLKHLRKSEEMF